MSGACPGIPDSTPRGGRRRSATATSFVDEGDVIDLGDRSFVVLHTPGHTAGSICLWDEANGTIFTGDAIYVDARLGWRTGRRSPLRSMRSAGPGRSRRPRRPRAIVRCARPSYDGGRDPGGVGLRTAAIPASESSIRGQQTLRELACQDRHAAGRATSHPGCLSTHPRSSACAVGPERAPDDATPCIPLGPIGSLSGRPFRPAITDDVGAGKDTGAAAIAMRAVDDRPERKPVRTTFQVSVIARPCGIARWSGFGPRPSGGQRRYARRLWANASILVPDRVIDTERGESVGERAVVVTGERIEGLIPATDIPEGPRVIRLDGSTLLPGLIDAHSHLIGLQDDGQGYASLITRTGAQEALTGVKKRTRHVARRFHDRPRRRNVPRVRRCRAARCDRGGVGRWPPDALRGRLRDVPGRGRRPHGACARCRRGRPAGAAVRRDERGRSDADERSPDPPVRGGLHQGARDGGGADVRGRNRASRSSPRPSSGPRSRNASSRRRSSPRMRTGPKE